MEVWPCLVTKMFHAVAIFLHLLVPKANSNTFKVCAAGSVPLPFSGCPGQETYPHRRVQITWEGYVGAG